MVFPVKSILPIQTTFGQILKVFMGQKKNPLPFSPSMRFIIFHGHHYANLRGLVSFYFSSLEGNHQAFKVSFCVQFFAGGIFLRALFGNFKG